MTELLAGIVGCGLIAGAPVRDGRPILGNHAAACQQVEGLRLVAAAEPDELRRASFGRQWGVTQLYPSVETMLAAQPLDIVIVTTPAAQHEAVCLAAVRAGVRGILCEKPFTGSATAAARIVDACSGASCRLVVNFSRRWDTSHRELAARIATGELGDIRTVFASYTGTIRGNGAHALDTLAMLVPGSWRSEWVGWLPAGLDDGPLEAVLVSEGARAYVAPVRDAEYFVFEIHILGTRGRARLLFQGNDIRIDAPAPHEGYPGYLYLDEASALPKMTLPATFAGALEELAQAVRQRREPNVPASAYLASLTLLDQLVKRAKENAS